MTKVSLLRIARLLTVAAGLITAGASGAAAENDFLAAREAFRAGDSRKLDTYARRLNNYILQPYVAYFQLRLRLDEAGAAEVRRFMANHADTPLAGRILADWLRLTGRTGQWDEFDAAHAGYTGEDLDIVCYSLSSRVRR